jgi:hypothetical protein
MNVILGENKYKVKEGEHLVTVSVKFGDQERYVNVTLDDDAELKTAIDVAAKELKDLI